MCVLTEVFPGVIISDTKKVLYCRLCKFLQFIFFRIGFLFIFPRFLEEKVCVGRFMNIILYDTVVAIAILLVFIWQSTWNVTKNEVCVTPKELFVKIYE